MTPPKPLPPPKAPPRPLDPAELAAVVAPVPGLVRAAVAYLACGEYDRWAAAGCRLVAMALMDLRRGELRRDMNYVREQVRFLEDYVHLIPERLAELRRPGTWAKNRQ
jgi:hypothetical protein